MMKRENDGWPRRIKKPRLRGGLTSEERHRLLSEAARAERGVLGRRDRAVDPLEPEQELEERWPAGR
jgi:hypothetical protein